MGNTVARRFGLVYTIDEAVRAAHQQVGADLPAFNGDESWELPMPGTFVVDQAGTVLLASVDPDRRPFVTAEMDVLEAAMSANEAVDQSSSPRREALRRCLERMPQAKGRRVLELRYGEGLPGEKVAEQVGLSLNALYTLLSRVRRSLQECIERRLQSEEAGT